MLHCLSTNINNGEQSDLKLVTLFYENISKQIEIFWKFKRNSKRKEHLKEN